MRYVTPTGTLSAAMLASGLLIGCGSEAPTSAGLPEEQSSAELDGSPTSEIDESNDGPKLSLQEKPMTGADTQESDHATTGESGAQKHTNRLINETSPYLLQHAHNPVDWYPWGEEAFEAARAQDKPIFLSVGYSTCYWCHVMERESFESEDVAAIMNEHFICIKVDREERPDVDDIYMTCVQLLTGRGGWPMSVFMEPQNLRPFFGGTYFPVQPGRGMITFPQLLQKVANAWRNERASITTDFMRISTRIVQVMSESQPPQSLSPNHVQTAIAQLLGSYDPSDGGFVAGQQRAPKFPMPANLDLLIKAAWNQQPVRDAVTHTLDRMAIGGMYDQVGGGFHRYSTDAMWLVPHFEKMLYDNGQLASTYAAAYERTSDPFYAEVIRETLDYVLREMTGDEGGFYSAQDAEVNAREGQNYLWKSDELTQALTKAGLADDITFALDVYGLAAGTNFQDPHHPTEPRSNVLHLDDRPDAIAAARSEDLDAFNARLARINEVLLAVRDTRDQPGTDDKTIAGWNGLMIAGMADGGRVLSEPRYVQAAARAAEFVLSQMRDDTGGLLRTYRQGEAKISAFFEDYALMTLGLLALHDATAEPRWLNEAKSLAAAARQRFWDDENDGYFDTLADQSDLFVRVKSTYDGAVPCGMSVMINNLIDLHERTGEQGHLDDAIATIRAMSWDIASRPTSGVLAVKGLHRVLESQPVDLLAFAESGGQPDAGAGGPVRVELIDAPIAADDTSIVASLTVRLSIDSPWHINAHEPGDASLIGLEIELVGAAGLTASIEYPTGEPFAGPIPGMFVHEGRVDVPVIIRATGEVSGKPQLVVRYQVCDDKQCLAPQREVLDVRIDEGD